jgi:hypothetical protein
MASSFLFEWPGTGLSQTDSAVSYQCSDEQQRLILSYIHVIQLAWLLLVLDERARLIVDHQHAWRKVHALHVSSTKPQQPLTTINKIDSSRSLRQVHMQTGHVQHV